MFACHNRRTLMTFPKFKATFHFPPSSVQKCNKMTFNVDNTFYKVTSTQTPSTCNSFSSPSARVTWFNAIQLFLCAKNSRLISFLFSVTSFSSHSTPRSTINSPKPPLIISKRKRSEEDFLIPKP